MKRALSPPLRSFLPNGVDRQLTGSFSKYLWASLMAKAGAKMVSLFIRQSLVTEHLWGPDLWDAEKEALSDYGSSPSIEIRSTNTSVLRSALGAALCQGVGSRRGGRRKRKASVPRDPKSGES